MKERLLELSREFLQLPTAPFREQRVAAFIVDFCRQRGIAVKQDGVGNLVASYGSRYTNPVFAFAAHMDHPGFLIEKDSVRKRTTALFYGGVAESYFKHANVRIVTAGGTVGGQVTGTEFNVKKRHRRVRLTLEGPVCKGDWGMWDLPARRIVGDRLYSRACDDLAGCLSVLMLLEELHRRKIRKHVKAVFSVAEEAGFHGTKHLCVHQTLSKKTLIVAIETSGVVPSVKMGEGVVIRVGDRSSIFTPALTGFLLEAAHRAASADKAFRFQRKLMDAGTCESTVYNHFGYTNAAVCVPLGNYHNQDRRTGKIAAEYVSVSDLENMVKLFLSVVRHCGSAPEWLKRQEPKYRRSGGELGEFFYF